MALLQLRAKLFDLGVEPGYLVAERSRAVGNGVRLFRNNAMTAADSVTH
jgi:hypothetical protein